MNDLTFADIVRTSHKKEFACDAYGQRSLIFFPLQQHTVGRTVQECLLSLYCQAPHTSLCPHAMLRVPQVLSSMLVAPDKFVQRCAIQNSTGEQAILTFELVLQECLQPSYKGVRVVSRWMLHNIQGECAVADQPTEAHPSLSPDAVVLAQLHSLRLLLNLYCW